MPANTPDRTATTEAEIINLEAHKGSSTVGAELQKARKKKSVTLKDAAKTLRISEAYLIALENDDFSSLPEQVYSLGFVRSYSSYLDLDSDELVARFKRQFTFDSSEGLNFPQPEEEYSKPSKQLVAIASCFGVLLVGAWSYYSSISAPSSAPQFTAEQIQTPVIKDEVMEEPQKVFPVEAYTAAPSVAEIDDKTITLTAGQTLTIRADQDSWIELKDSKGKVFKSQTLKEGDSFSTAIEDDLIFSTGNAGGIVFSVDDSPFQVLGKPGEVLSQMKLNFPTKEQAL